MIQIDTEALKIAGRLIKEAMPNFDGNVQFNLSRQHLVPKININVADVTGAKDGMQRRPQGRP